MRMSSRSTRSKHFLFFKAEQDLNREGHVVQAGDDMMSVLFIIILCIVRKYTPQIVYKVAICPRGNLPCIQITSIVLPYIRLRYKRSVVY